MNARLVVKVFRDRSPEPIEREFFESPISIGRDGGNLLHLDHPAVSKRQGALVFTSDGAYYVHHATERGAVVGGIELDAGVAVPLRNDSSIQLGPFKLQVELDVQSGAVPGTPLTDDTTEVEPEVRLDEP
jgi:predicted component of type VI protein secretion system